MTHTVLEVLSKFETNATRESLCLVMENGMLYKVRFQTHPLSGIDHIWLAPGEAERGYSFSFDEAQAASDKHNLGLLYEYSKDYTTKHNTPTT